MGFAATSESGSNCWARRLRHDRQREIVAIAAFVAGLEIVAVHRHDRAIGRLLKVPIIGFALVLLIAVKTVPAWSVPEIFGWNANLAPLIVTSLAITRSACDQELRSQGVEVSGVGLKKEQARGGKGCRYFCVGSRGKEGPCANCDGPETIPLPPRMPAFTITVPCRWRSRFRLSLLTCLRLQLFLRCKCWPRPRLACRYRS